MAIFYPDAIGCLDLTILFPMDTICTDPLFPSEKFALSIPFLTVIPSAARNLLSLIVRTPARAVALRATA